MSASKGRGPRTDPPDPRRTGKYGGGHTPGRRVSPRSLMDGVDAGRGSAPRGGGGLGERRHVLDELGQGLVERRAGQLEADDGPLGVDEERRRDRADAEGLDEVPFAGGVVDLPP